MKKEVARMNLWLYYVSSEYNSLSEFWNNLSFHRCRPIFCTYMYTVSQKNNALDFWSYFWQVLIYFIFLLQKKLFIYQFQGPPSHVSYPVTPLTKLELVNKPVLLVNKTHEKRRTLHRCCLLLHLFWRGMSVDLPVGLSVSWKQLWFKQKRRNLSTCVLV